jgi:predicted metal-dependent peptidase
LLRQFIATAGRTGHRASWQREHRRFQHLTPGRRPRRELRLLVAVDVSDSTDQRPLREVFARELLAIAAGRASQITVLYAGSRIQRIETFRGRRNVAEVYSGGGYTDLRPAFAFAATMQPRPAALVYLTDGFGPAPEAAPLPTLWVLTPEGRRPAPWGVELRLAIEAN